MLLFVGLGNPTPDNENNRHNIGFKIIDAINQKFGLSKQKPKFKGLLTTGNISGKKVISVKNFLEELKKSKIIVVEGTLYPLLNRLKTLGFVSYNWKESTHGPPRKYYSLTDSGKKHMKELLQSWKEIDAAVKKIIKLK